MGGCKDCDDCGGNIPVGEIGPQGPKGDTGATGAAGTSVVQSFVSDGITMINGVLYPINTLVQLLSSGSYISAGVIYTITPLVWQNLELINGWTASIGANAPQYAIGNGFLYLRGAVIKTGATDDAFASLDAGFTDTVRSVVSDADVTTPVFSAFDVAGAASELRIIEYTNTSQPWRLDSVGPISIR